MRLAPIMVISLLMSVGTGGPARAARADPISREEKIGSCIHTSAGGHVWLERTLWALRDQERGRVGSVVANTNGTQDLGPMQVNSSWVTKIARLTRRPSASVRWRLIQDACFNVDVARWIFLSNFTVTGGYWKAVGAYHSPTEWRRKRYAGDVASLLVRRFGADVFTVRRAGH